MPLTTLLNRKYGISHSNFYNLVLTSISSFQSGLIRLFTKKRRKVQGTRGIRKVNGLRQAVLVLENGKYFTGTGFGATKTVTGELVFNTATAAGYNAILTDPSNQGQIVMLTYPPIGNYGVPAVAADEFGIDKHFESDSIKLKGLVVFECCKKPFHWESVKNLDTFMKEQGVIEK